MTIAASPPALYVVGSEPRSLGPVASPSAPRVGTVYDAGVRTLQALSVETGDHIWRAVTDATMTAVLMTRARTPMQAFELFEAYQRRALEANTEHLNQMLSLCTRAVEENWRGLQVSLAKTARA